MRLRGEDRFRSEFDGVRSWHCLSAGAHYDPSRVALGPVVGVDEHAVDVGAGFDWHAHRDVFIVTWVLDGVLRHEDSDGGVRAVGAGTMFVQSTGDGMRHRETNASSTDALRMIQLTLLGSVERRVRAVTPPVVVGQTTVDVVHGPATASVSDGFVFVTRGADAGSLSDGVVDVDVEALIVTSENRE